MESRYGFFGQQLVLYHSGINFSDEEIIETLNVERSVPILHIDSYYWKGHQKDEFEKIEKELYEKLFGKSKSCIGYKIKEKTFGEFFSPIEEVEIKLKEERSYILKGRVWIQKLKPSPYNYSLQIITNKITGKDKLKKLSFKKDKLEAISTYPYNSYFSPDSPTTHPEIIQKYIPKFINLIIKKALNAGFPKLTLNGYFITPEYLEIRNYKIKWNLFKNSIKGKKERETIILKRNKHDMWSTIIQFDIENQKENEILDEVLIYLSLNYNQLT